MCMWESVVKQAHGVIQYDSSLDPWAAALEML
jgi:hypothetical protein